MRAHVFDPDVSIPEQLPGEPECARPGNAKLALAVVVRTGLLCGMLVATAGLWPWLLLGARVWGRPPNVVHLRRVLRYLRLIWTESPPPPGLGALVRAWLTLAVLHKVAVAPVWGLAWLLDELLYGRALDATPLEAPLLEISAGRSGSTQLARYLGEDPGLASPNLLQFTFPFLWLWKLVPVTIGRVVSKDRVRQELETRLRPEFLQRHEGDPFATDSFEGCLFIPHMQMMSPLLGPRVTMEDFHFATPAEHNMPLWECEFVQLLDRIGRKTLLHCGPGPDGQPRRFFVKGHFLAAAPALAERFPDARFLTMVRHPSPRIQSAVNFLRTNPLDPLLGPVPWAWLAQALSQNESEYCVHEQAWFTAPGDTRRCVVRFDDYVRDLEGAMSLVYRECLDQPELPPWAPREHTPRERKDYLLNRSLEQLGIDRDALERELADFIAWCSPRG